VVGRSIRSGQPGPVHGEHHGRFCRATSLEHLVKAALEEGGIDVDNGPTTRLGHPAATPPRGFRKSQRRRTASGNRSESFPVCSLDIAAVITATFSFRPSACAASTHRVGVRPSPRLSSPTRSLPVRPTWSITGACERDRIFLAAVRPHPFAVNTCNKSGPFGPSIRGEFSATRPDRAVHGRNIGNRIPRIAPFLERGLQPSRKCSSADCATLRSGGVFEIELMVSFDP